jgi:hypothetical protein
VVLLNVNIVNRKKQVLVLIRKKRRILLMKTNTVKFGKSGGTVSSRSVDGFSDTNVVIIEEDPDVVKQKYDLMEDLMGVDVLMLFRKVLKEEETQVEGGVQTKFRYFPRI